MTIVSPVQWASTVLMDNSNCELHVTWSRRCCEFRYTSASDPLFEYRTLTHNPLLREMLYSLRHPLSRDVLFIFIQKFPVTAAVPAKLPVEHVKNY